MILSISLWDSGLLFELLVVFCFLTVGSLLMQGEGARNLLAVFLIGWSFFYDYISYQLNLLLGIELVSIKFFIELLAAQAFLLILIKGVISKSRLLGIFVLLIVAGAAALIGFSNGHSVKLIYIDFRSIFLPVVLFVLLSSVGFFESVNVRLVMSWGWFILMLNGFVSIWDYIWFTGDYEEYWRYQSLMVSKENVYGERFNASQLVYQLVRDGELRSSGFVVSALTASLLYAFYAIYFLFQFLVLKRNIFWALFFFLLSMIFIYVTNVRAGFLMVIFSFFMILLQKIFRAEPLRRFSVFIAPLIAFLSIWIYLALGRGYGIDASALGRLDQYQFFFKEFIFLGHGMGSFPKMFDSFFIYAALEVGGVALILPYIIFKLFRSAAADNKFDGSNLYYIQFSVFIFVCMFQHVAGSAYYFLFLFYLMVFGRGALELKRWSVK